MPQVTRLSSGDIDRALMLVAEAAGDDGGQPFERLVIERLLELVPAERAGYYECTRDGEKTLFCVRTIELEWDWEVFRATQGSWPLRDERSRGVELAVKLSDFLSRGAQRRNSWYQGIMRPHSAEYECKLWLPSPPGIVRGFFLVRGPGDRDFDEHDRSVLTILRPHLAAIRERWDRRRRPAGLTDRELEVLRLLRQGLTNREIAERLVIATGTVRTHLENIFERLGVHTRTAAVARAFTPGARP